jgi:hypothetical protein
MTTLGQYSYTEFGSIHGTVILGERALHFLGYEIDHDGDRHLSTHRQIPLNRIEDISIKSLIRFDGLAFFMLSLLWDPQKLFGSGISKLGPLGQTFYYQVLDAKQGKRGKYYDSLSNKILPNKEILHANIFTKGLSDFRDPFVRNSEFTPLRVMQCVNQNLPSMLELTGCPEIGPITFDNDHEEMSFRNPTTSTIEKFHKLRLFSRSVAVTVTDSLNGQKHRFECISAKSDEFLSELIDEVTKDDASERSDNNVQSQVLEMSNGNLISQIQQLGSMYETGLLTLDEFKKAKEKLLNDD